MTGTAGLEAAVGLTVGRLDLDVSLSVGPGEVVALLGPNGAGKSTLLRALAGLAALDQGSVVLAGEVLEDVGAGVRLPPEQRRVGVVFQDRLLFPHLSVLENVAFGLRCAGAGRATARREAQVWLERLGLAQRGASRPTTLSGGEAQRVALARALAGRPRLLLLDEPLSALDASARVEVRRHLRRHLASFDGVRLLVTHDPLEAAALGHRVVVLEEGRVVQAGSLAQLSARPRSAYVADLVGVNLFEGRADGDRVALQDGGALVAVGGPRSGPVLAVVHPHAVALHRRRPEGTPRNVWAGCVESVDLEGERARVQVTGPPAVVAEVTPAAVADLALAPGQQVWASVKASEVTVYPA
ncbi:MAG: ABC transporter ATP-binding protein [Acidimicrobiales bacterium]